MLTLAQILSGIDSTVTPMKRRITGLLSDPKGTGQQLMGLLGDQSRNMVGTINMAQDGNELRAAGSVMADLPQYKQATNQVLQGLMSVAPIGATLYHGGTLVPNPTNHGTSMQGVAINGIPAVSTTRSPFEAKSYAIHNGGSLYAIDDKGLKIYKRGQDKAIDAMWDARDFNSIKKAGFDGVDHSGANVGTKEVLLFDPTEVYKRSQKFADYDPQFIDGRISKVFRRTE